AVVTQNNSLVGSRPFDLVGDLFVTALSNGNYVVPSPFWDNGPLIPNAGAATWGDGFNGTTHGLVSPSNSLVGSNPVDEAGSRVTALSNGNYVVPSFNWNGGGGAATWGDGTTMTAGPVNASNSLVGSNPGDEVGIGGVTALSNGNYLLPRPPSEKGRLPAVGAA